MAVVPITSLTQNTNSVQGPNSTGGGQSDNLQSPTESGKLANIRQLSTPLTKLFGVGLDLNETFNARLPNEEAIAKAKELGYEVHMMPKHPIKKGEKTIYVKDSDAMAYAIRPGSLEFLEWLKNLDPGVRTVLATKNIQHHKDVVVEQAGFRQHLDLELTRADLTSEENKDYETYPNHPMNKLGKIKWLKGFTRHWTKDLKDDTKRWVKSKFNEEVFYYRTNFPLYRKHPAMWGCRVLVDNMEERTTDAINSGTFIHIHIPEFTALKPEQKDANGNYIWVENLKKQILEIYQKGWETVYEEKYGKKPVVTPVKLIDKAKPLFDTGYNKTQSETKVAA